VGIIVPELHYGRDALAGIALFLSHLAINGLSMTGLRSQYPSLVMDKVKVSLEPGTDIERILHRLAERYHSRKPNTKDGVKVDFEDGWFHVRRSNTEPIIRVYTEAPDDQSSKALSASVTGEILDLVKIC